MFCPGPVFVFFVRMFCGCVDMPIFLFGSYASSVLYWSYGLLAREAFLFLFLFLKLNFLCNRPVCAACPIYSGATGLSNILTSPRHKQQTYVRDAGLRPDCWI